MSGEYVKLVEREESALFVSLISRGFAPRHFHNALGWDFGIDHHRYEDASHFIAVSDAQRLRAFIDSSLKDDAFLRSFIGSCKSAGERLLKTAASIVQQPFDSEMLQRFSSFCMATKDMVPFLAAVVLVERSLGPFMLKQLEREAPKQSDPQKLLAGLLVPDPLPDSIVEIRDTYQLAAQVASNNELRRLFTSRSDVEILEELRSHQPVLYEDIRDHAGRFGWLRTHGYRFDPMSEHELVERIISILKRWGPAQIAEVADRRESFDVADILGFKPSNALSQSIDHLRQLVALRFYRIDVHLQADCIVRPFMKRIAELCGCTRDELIFAAEWEIDAALRNTTHLRVHDLRIRAENWFWIKRDWDDVSIGAYEPALSRMANPVHAGDRPISGVSASPGKVRGKVKIVFGAEDMNKVQLGDILVTTMTTPDLMLAIEKAAAIVTDEGGVLSHAAVISRELKIPAVIATSSATRLLKDGQIVEVDATGTEGTVRLVADSHDLGQAT